MIGGRRAEVKHLLTSSAENSLRDFTLSYSAVAIITETGTAASSAAFEPFGGACKRDRPNVTTRNRWPAIATLRPSRSMCSICGATPSAIKSLKGKFSNYS